MRSFDQEKQEIEINKFIGKKMKNKRLKLGISQQHLAKAMNCSHQLIQKQESGEVRIQAGTLLLIAQNLGVDPSYFYQGYDNKRDNDLQPQLPVSSSIIKGLNKKEWNILLIEDSPEDDFLFRKAFDEIESDKIFHIKTCYNGVEGLSYLKELINTNSRNNLPDLIFIDLNIPKKDGFELLREIKRDVELYFIPLIITTNSINAKEMFDCYKLQASGYLTKSFDIKEFTRKITATIEYWTRAVNTPKNY